MTCLGLVCYTSWVKPWSKAMDFLQTFFLDKYFFIAHTRENILEINKARNWFKHIAPYYRFLLPKDFDAKTPEIDAN